MGNTAKNPMELISYGLYLVTAKNGEEKDNGCIVNTFSQITSTPNRVSLAVNKANYTHDIILATGKFNVSLLTTEAPFALFRQFGFQSGKELDKFNGVTAIQRSENGLLYLTECSNAYISATVDSAIDCGTHTLFIATVSAAEVLSDKPSLTYDYYHKEIKPAPTTCPPGTNISAAPPSTAAPPARYSQLCPTQSPAFSYQGLWASS